MKLSGSDHGHGLLLIGQDQALPTAHAMYHDAALSMPPEERSTMRRAEAHVKAGSVLLSNSPNLINPRTRMNRDAFFCRILQT